MLKVIIVDDEQFIAQGLQALIDWNAAGYEAVSYTHLTLPTN